MTDINLPKSDMYMSDEKVQEVLNNLCGTPPRRELVEYHIWVNSIKLEFYSKQRNNRLWTEAEFKDLLDSYRRLVKAGVELLTSIVPDGQLQLNL
jgi:hypothetical protein